MEGSMVSDSADRETYEAPRLLNYGTIEEWTQGPCNELVCISIVLP
jgi:hypothetical protein